MIGPFPFSLLDLSRSAGALGDFGKGVVVSILLIGCTVIVRYAGGMAGIPAGMAGMLTGIGGIGMVGIRGATSRGVEDMRF